MASIRDKNKSIPKTPDPQSTPLSAINQLSNKVNYLENHKKAY